jgi:ThiF family
VIVPQLLNPDVFYAERDNRAALEHPALSSISPRRVAIVVPSNTSPSRGVETALFWTASIVRRMGRPFAEVILVAENSFRQRESRLGAAGLSVEECVNEELSGADPFGRIEWRTPDSDLSDAAAVVWLGTLPQGTRNQRTLTVNAYGWIAAVFEPPTATLTLSPADFDAAPATIVMAACIAAGRIFAEAFGATEHPTQVAFALDSGAATDDGNTCGAWLASGSTVDEPIPWNADLGPELTLDRLLVISAGGIGSNFCRILGESHFRANSIVVIDPDVYDVSNLNRAIGISLSQVGLSKALVTADFLRRCTSNALGVQASYESWVTPKLAADFRARGAAVILGVDQVQTRLSAGCDWPWLLLNGATSGATFSTSAHIHSEGGCIGCWYGLNEATYSATRAPMACAAGVNAGKLELRATASYPFVSIASAAQLVATLARAAANTDKPETFAGTTVSMSLRSPQFAQSRRIRINDRCLLLCAEQYLQTTLGRRVGA